jgi:hypothetical protein
VRSTVGAFAAGFRAFLGARRLTAAPMGGETRRIGRAATPMNGGTRPIGVAAPPTSGEMRQIGCAALPTSRGTREIGCAGPIRGTCGLGFRRADRHPLAPLRLQPAT